MPYLPRSKNYGEVVLEMASGLWTKSSNTWFNCMVLGISLWKTTWLLEQFLRKAQVLETTNTNAKLYSIFQNPLPWHVCFMNYRAEWWTTRLVSFPCSPYSFRQHCCCHCQRRGQMRTIVTRFTGTGRCFDVVFSLMRCQRSLGRDFSEGPIAHGGGGVQKARHFEATLVAKGHVCATK